MILKFSSVKNKNKIYFKIKRDLQFGGTSALQLFRSPNVNLNLKKNVRFSLNLSGFFLFYFLKEKVKKSAKLRMQFELLKISYCNCQLISAQIVLRVLSYSQCDCLHKNQIQFFWFFL